MFVCSIQMQVPVATHLLKLVHLKEAILLSRAILLNNLPQEAILLNNLPQEAILLNNLPQEAILLNNLPQEAILLNNLPQEAIQLLRGGSLPRGAISLLHTLPLLPSLCPHHLLQDLKCHWGSISWYVVCASVHPYASTYIHTYTHLYSRRQKKFRIPFHSTAVKWSFFYCSFYRCVPYRLDTTADTV